MITDNNKLEIFESFVIDSNIKKTVSDTNTRSRIDISSGFVMSQRNDLTNAIYQVNKSPYNILYRLNLWCIKKKYKFRGTSTDPNPAKKFFEAVKNELKSLKDNTDNPNVLKVKYLATMDLAFKASQTALVERLTNMLENIQLEVSLIDSGFDKYLTEEQIVKFYQAASKNDKGYPLKLDWIKNFVRVIPADIVELKQKADALNIFDNYVVLHYDPFNTGTGQTNKEIEEIKKDPILFGVIRNSRKMYYIGDWIDEYCSLTLDKLVEAISEDEKYLSQQDLIKQ